MNKPYSWQQNFHLPTLSMQAPRCPCVGVGVFFPSLLSFLGSFHHSRLTQSSPSTLSLVAVMPGAPSGKKPVGHTLGTVLEWEKPGERAGTGRVYLQAHPQGPPSPPKPCTLQPSTLTPREPTAILCMMKRRKRNALVSPIAIFSLRLHPNPGVEILLTRQLLTEDPPSLQPLATSPKPRARRGALQEGGWLCSHAAGT